MVQGSRSSRRLDGPTRSLGVSSWGDSHTDDQPVEEPTRQQHKQLVLATERDVTPETAARLAALADRLRARGGIG